MRKRITRPDSLLKQGTSGEYYLQVKSVIENKGKFEYLLLDADMHEYNAIAYELYPEGELLRCMVWLKFKEGRLLLEKVGICKEQNPKSSRQGVDRGKTKYNVIDLDTMVESGRVTVAEDVKKLLEAIDGGQTIDELRSEIIRLNRIIVDGCLQDVVIEGCGEKSLKRVLRLAKSFRPKPIKRKTITAKKVSTKDVKGKKKEETVLSKEESDYRILDNALREKWCQWFKENVNKKNNRYLYNATLKAANYLNFVELQDLCKTEKQFYIVGLVRCNKIAKNLGFYITTTEKKKKTKTSKKKKPQENYGITGSPHITRKDWGSPYKPARG